jgi:lysophospholipase L1-like esterase
MQYAYGYQLNGTQTAGLDPDAKAYIASAGVSDTLAIWRVNEIVKYLKQNNLWSTLTDAFLLGSKFQSSSSTLKSLNLIRTASGSSTFADWGGSFDAITNGYTFTNADAESPVSTGFSWMTLHQHDPVAAPHTLLGSYNPVSTRGPYLTIGYAGTGLNPETAVRLYTSTDGTVANTFINRNNVDYNDDWGYAFAQWDGSQRTVTLDNLTETTGSVASVWNNLNTMGLGMVSNTAFRFDGRIMAAFLWSNAIGVSAYNNFRTRLREVFSSTIPFRPAVIFDGNSLTGGTSGGGTTWPAKLLLKSGWNSTYLRYQNYAQNGDRLIEDNLPRLPSIVSSWKPYGSEDVLLIAWPAINDITAGYSTAQITSAYEEYCNIAKAANFRLAICTLTPVASVGDGTAYQYTSAQQLKLSQVNSWIRTSGSQVADQVVDFADLISTYPAFGDPVDTTYYVDGLHHNDTGRALIADFIDSEISKPTYTPF